MQLFDMVTLKKVLVIITLMLVASGIVFVTLNSHAVERHGDAASSGSQCFDAKGSQLHMTNPTTKRNADVCFDTVFYVYITTASGDPVTMIPKEKMNNIEQVIQYLKNAGYR